MQSYRHHEESREHVCTKELQWASSNWLQRNGDPVIAHERIQNNWSMEPQRAKRKHRKQFNGMRKTIQKQNEKISKETENKEPNKFWSWRVKSLNWRIQQRISTSDLNKQKIILELEKTDQLKLCNIQIKKKEWMKEKRRNEEILQDL